MALRENKSESRAKQMFLFGAGATLAAAALARWLELFNGDHPNLIYVFVTQTLVLLNMLGWGYFASALTGVAGLPHQQGERLLGYGAGFLVMKTLALAGALVWVVRFGVVGIEYLAFGALSQLAFAALFSLFVSARDLGSSQ